MAYLILEFEDGVQMVPKSWMSLDQRTCAWPNCKSQARLDIYIQERIDPEPTWEYHEVKRIFGSSDNFDKAKQKLALSLKYSDIETDSDKEQYKRGKKRKLAVNHSESSSDEHCGIINKFISQLPAVPSAHLLSTSSVTEVENLKTSTARIKNIDKESAFNHRVLKKLNMLLLRMEVLEEKVDNISKIRCPDLNYEKIISWFPLKSVEEIETFEENMKSEAEKIDAISGLQCIGGSNSSDMTRKIMKRMFIDQILEKFNWTGMNNKKCFKDLTVPCIIYRSVKSKFPDATETAVNISIANYLKYSKQRRQRVEFKLMMRRFTANPLGDE